VTDYYTAIKQSVGNLGTHDQAALHAYYDRVRRLVLERLQTADPPLSGEDIRGETTALEKAIARLESELRPPDIPIVTTPAPAAKPVPRPRGDTASGFPPPRPKQGSPRDKARSQKPVPPLSRRQLMVCACVLAIIAAGGSLAWLMTDGSPPSNPPTSPVVPAAAPTRAEQPSSTRPREESTTNPDQLPYILRRQIAFYRSTHPPGTLVISKSQGWLYLVKTNTSAMRYAVGVGPDCSELAGLFSISPKDRDPLRPQSPLPASVPNDGGARTINIGVPNCHLRAAGRPSEVGPLASSPGIRLTKDDLLDLYDRVEPGTRLVIAN
jgi:lipoprotein-anchoring transpeptidase ErfK/SrfK